MIIILREKTSRKMFMLTFFPGFEARLLRAVLYFTTWLSSSRHKGQKGNLPFFLQRKFRRHVKVYPMSERQTDSTELITSGKEKTISQLLDISIRFI